MEENNKVFLSTSEVALTVLMPVYNGERFLKSAVESILSQTYTDFEFLIINDGSTDNSDKIIRSFHDKRITLVSNEKNSGLISTLNKGIKLARGKYIARMDGDDISMPVRLSKQVSFLEVHPEISMVASHIQLMDEEGNDLGNWQEDIQTKTGKQIKALLPYTNCIAHPSIVIRTDVAKEFLYDEKQVNNEDWDLWMRLVSEGHKLAKVNESLLKYRIHTNSITLQSNQKNVNKKLLRTQKNYFFKKIIKSKINLFDLRVLWGLTLNAVEVYTGGIFSRLKRSINKFIKVKIPRKVNRLKMLIRFRKIMKSSGNDSGLFFFFPFYHVGGAERVHIDILKTVADKNPWIFFTNESENDSFYNEFSNYGKIFDISSFSGKYKWLTKKIISNKINKTNNALTFGCNSHFYYKLIPFLNKEVRCMDLIHAFSDKGTAAAEDWSLPFIDRLSRRVFISQRAIKDLEDQYIKNKIPSSFTSNIKYIPNQVNVPKLFNEKKQQDILHALYVGRGTKEKRVHLIAEIARQCSQLNLPIQFELIGNLKKSIGSKFHPYLKFSGEIKDVSIVSEKYKEANILLITSFREGFPMVIMEGMANGVVPMSTDVGDISFHVKHKQNGVIISNKDESEIVNAFIKEIKELCVDRKKLSNLSLASYLYASKNFDYNRFRMQYRELLLGEIAPAES
ncbi:MAG TPA: glycosyltransferase [Cytophagaceae bacterium]|jgi:glycosyltransferase involved in cell wall biosynthesis|nr:glycosyltransferase [Cytophagaceae bacterium]